MDKELRAYVESVDNGYGIDSDEIRDLVNEISQLRAEVDKLKKNIHDLVDAELDRVAKEYAKRIWIGEK